MLDISLVILALCTLIQTGFFLFDRWKLSRYRPSTVVIPGRSAFSLGMEAFGAAALVVILVALATRAARAEDWR